MSGNKQRQGFHLNFPSRSTICIRSEDMKKGYMAELQSREKEFQDTKAGLEALYMRKETEEEINGCDELRCQFLVAIGNVDDLVTTYAGTVKSVKLAVET